MKDALKPRQAEILKYLMTSSSPLDIEFFKEKLLKSERTIRYDIQELKDICIGYQIEIRYLTKKGYYIPASQKSACSVLLVQSETDKKEVFGHSQEEKSYWDIFLFLFLQKEEWIQHLLHLLYAKHKNARKVYALYLILFSHHLKCKPKGNSVKDAEYLSSSEY